MIRLLVGMQKRVLGLVELDDANDTAVIHVVGYDLISAQPPLAADVIVNILTWERRFKESDVDLLRALPKRLRGYTWARDVSPRPKGALAQ